MREALAEIYGYVETQRFSSYVQLTRELQGRESGTLPMLNKLSDTNIGQKVAQARSPAARRGEHAGLPRGQPNGARRRATRSG